MTKTRTMAAGAAAAIAAGALLTGVVFAGSDGAMANDADDNAGTGVAGIAQTTTLTGEAKGDAISAAAKAMTTTDADEATESDEDEATDSDEDAADESESDVDNDHAGAANTSNDHGTAVSTLATTTTLTGEAKGDAISALASSNSQRGHSESSQAAEHSHH